MRGGVFMRLVPGFQLRVIGSEYLAVPSGPAASRFNGLMMLNETSAFLVRCLQEGADRETLLRRLGEEYDAPEELLRADLEDFLARMREAGLLEEEAP